MALSAHSIILKHNYKRDFKISYLNTTCRYFLFAISIDTVAINLWTQLCFGRCCGCCTKFEAALMDLEIGFDADVDPGSDGAWANLQQTAKSAKKLALFQRLTKEAILQVLYHKRYLLGKPAR